MHVRRAMKGDGLPVGRGAVGPSSPWGQMGLRTGTLALLLWKPSYRSACGPQCVRRLRQGRPGRDPVMGTLPGRLVCPLCFPSRHLHPASHRALPSSPATGFHGLSGPQCLQLQNGMILAGNGELGGCQSTPPSGADGVDANALLIRAPNAPALHTQAPSPRIRQPGRAGPENREAKEKGPSSQGGAPVAGSGLPEAQPHLPRLRTPGAPGSFWIPEGDIQVLN